MKKLLVIFTALLLSIGFMNIDKAEALTSEKQELQDNQSYLFYMYSNENGHYFLDPEAEYENVIWIGKNDFDNMPKDLHHGDKIIGVFVDDEKWELESIK